VHKLWRTEDGQRVRTLREALGWDESRLAQRCALSAAQVRQLENGGECKFYSAAIKAQAGRRALSCLEAAAASLSSPPMKVQTPPAGPDSSPPSSNP
jgi:hypothetical protein